MQTLADFNKLNPPELQLNNKYLDYIFNPDKISLNNRTAQSVFDLNRL